MKTEKNNHLSGRLNRKRLLNIILLLITTLHQHDNHVFAQAKNKQPNIVLIMADDLGYEAIGANGGSSYATPHLDKMATEGMRFTYAHSTPLCSPSRVQLMTGKYNHRNYVGFGVMDTTDVTFAHLLKDAGYKTGIAGKWQLDGNEQQRQLVGGIRGAYPEEMGFDEYLLWNIHYEARDWRYKNPVLFSNDGKKRYPGQYGPDLFLAWSKQFIEKNKTEPFFLYYPMVLTHDPFQATPDHPDWESSAPAGRGDNVYFGPMVSYMDRIVNEIIVHVRKLGISENTLIIFTGDNGTKRTITSVLNGKKVRGGKGSTKLTGTHVPFIALWDGKIAPGQVNDNLLDFTDVLPTLMQTANRKLPASFFTDGISFYDQLLGNKNAKKRESIFCYYDPKWGKVQKAVWIHDENWKLYETGEFYNLKNDPNEQHPVQEDKLTKKEKKIKQSLHKRMQALLK